MSRSRCSIPGCTSPARGPFLVAQEVLPAMRKNGRGSFFFSNNSSSLRGKKRMTGQSLYYPRVLMRTLAQVLTEDYSEHGVHVANIVIDGSINSPGSRKLPRNQNRTDLIINPVKIAEAYWYLHTQDQSCWTHELQLTPFASQPELLSAWASIPFGLRPKRSCAIIPALARYAGHKAGRRQDWDFLRTGRMRGGRRRRRRSSRHDR